MIKGGSPMYNLTEHQQSTGMAPSATRGALTAFGARHVEGVAVSRWVAAVCFVIAGALVVGFGHWWGLVFFVAAGLNCTLAYLVPRWNRRSDTPSNARLSP
jgi:membrane protein implicated in regulation of membrane protease activity